MENAARQADARGEERQGLKILEGALKRATGDEPEFQAAQEYRDELVERIKESGPQPENSQRSSPNSMGTV
ncbi:hypothetical protein [Actinophytocola xanthii]|uniref:hypothetical protein n=1 Tax=Actinophytocola xanthii TaxID=1912961 RepID=UPI001E4545AE|nr:hypothetical protein [Actinophytocola xanthii]